MSTNEYNTISGIFHLRRHRGLGAAAAAAAASAVTAAAAAAAAAIHSGGPVDHICQIKQSKDLVTFDAHC